MAPRQTRPIGLATAPHCATHILQINSPVQFLASLTRSGQSKRPKLFVKERMFVIFAYIYRVPSWYPPVNWLRWKQNPFFSNRKYRCSIAKFCWSWKLYTSISKCVLYKSQNNFNSRRTLSLWLFLFFLLFGKCAGAPLDQKVPKNKWPFANCVLDRFNGIVAGTCWLVHLQQWEFEANTQAFDLQSIVCVFFCWVGWWRERGPTKTLRAEKPLYGHVWTWMYVYTQNPSLQIEDEPQSVPRSNTWLTSACRVNGRHCEPTWQTALLGSQQCRVFSTLPTLLCFLLLEVCTERHMIDPFQQQITRVIEYKWKRPEDKQMLPNGPKKSQLCGLPLKVHIAFRSSVWTEGMSNDFRRGRG